DGRHHVRHHASGDGRAEGGIQAQDAHQVRVHLQVLSASLHQALQPHDPRALAQGRRHVHVRGVWQDLQAAGQPEAAQIHSPAVSDCYRMDSKGLMGGDTSSLNYYFIALLHLLCFPFNCLTTSARASECCDNYFQSAIPSDL
ncbi:hypothetical protein FOCC_FOCC005323, partial [Frankliniella occidentalis]